MIFEKDLSGHLDVGSVQEGPEVFKILLITFGCKSITAPKEGSREI
jgi:hypothetical protein